MSMGVILLMFGGQVPYHFEGLTFAKGKVPEERMRTEKGESLKGCSLALFSYSSSPSSLSTNLEKSLACHISFGLCNSLAKEFV
jgi:hypothetical protein